MENKKKVDDPDELTYTQLIISILLSILVIAGLAFCEYHFKEKVPFEETFMGQVLELRQKSLENFEELQAERAMIDKNK